LRQSNQKKQTLKQSNQKTKKNNQTLKQSKQKKIIKKE